MEEEIVIDPCNGGASVPIGCLVEKISTMVPPKAIFRGIIHPSIGCIFGPSKSFKTTFTESLLLSMSAGLTTFLGEPLYAPSKRVLLVSMEEFYRNRTERNKKQITHLTDKHQLDPSWSENVYVVDETFPRYLFSDNDWAKLEAEIVRVKPSVVMLDSLTRMTVDPIEDSTVASKVMRKLRELAFKYGITMIIIHHSQKIENKALTIASLAGSRVIGQELDFMIGINRTSNNIRYLKDVAYRYAPDDSEHVMIFNSNESQIVEKISLGEEAAIIAGSGASSPTFNKDELVLDFILEYTNQDPAIVIESSLLVQNLVESRKMVKPTLYAALKRLLDSKIIEKIGKGQFKLVGPSSI